MEEIKDITKINNNFLGKKTKNIKKVFKQYQKKVECVLNYELLNN